MMDGEMSFGVVHNIKPDGTPCGSGDLYIGDNCPVCEFSRSITCFGCGSMDRIKCECEKASTPGMSCCVACETWFKGEDALCGPCHAEVEDGAA